MTTPFPYPLPLDALRAFTHRRPDHPLHNVWRYGDGLAACNGWAAIRCNRGMWLDKDHPEATGETLRRLDALPWKHHSTLPATLGWIPLDDHRGRIMSRPLSLWQDKESKLSPSPIWLIAASARVRLSLLQLVARLPRAEIHPPGSPSSPMAFRFSGGTGFLAPMPEALFSYHLCLPRRDPLSGEESPSHIRKTTFQGGPMFKGTWPPPEPLD